MEYLFEHWDEIKGRIEDKHLFLFLDYDGTLAPLLPRPNDALLPEETRFLLAELSRTENLLLAVVSGRKLEDVRRKVGLEGIIYSGNHGLELSSPKVKFEELATPGYKSILRDIKNALIRKLSGIRGVVIEDRDITLLVHYRLVDPERVAEVKTVFHEATIVYLIRNKIKIKENRTILEIWPPVNWDKGKIVKWLLARQELAGEPDDRLPVYVGDDTTDDDAFRALKSKGVTIFVATVGSRSEADYYLKDQKEVSLLLKMLVDAKK